MLEIGARPVLEYNVRLAVKHGFCEIVINTHYRAELILEHFGDGSSFGATISYSHEPELLGTAGALNPLRDFFKDETFAVMYGDNLTDVNLSAIVSLHRKSRSAGTIALFWRQDPTASGIVALDQNDLVTRFLEKPQPNQVFSNWVNAGILILEPAVFDVIPNLGFSDFGRDILPKMLDEGMPLTGYKMTENLWWIDSQADYDRTRRAFADNI